MIRIKYGRRSICAGDDMKNGRYIIELPDEAALSDLIDAVAHGGHGNTWPIPTSHDTVGWNLFTNIGIIAVVACDCKSAEYKEFDGSTPLAPLGIEWVYCDAEGEEHTMNQLIYRFRD